MIVELESAFTPDEMYEESCGICGDRFRCESIVAWVRSDNLDDMNRACPSCVGTMGRRNPKRFPTIEEHEAAKKRFPGPIWDTDDGAARAWEIDDGVTHDAIVAANEIAREMPARPAVFVILDGDRSKVFAHITTHLDFVASMDEEDHGGSPVAEYIREVLMPFCEVEGGLKSDAERWAEYEARKGSGE